MVLSIHSYLQGLGSLRRRHLKQRMNQLHGRTIASYRWSIRWVAQLDGNWLPVWLKQTDLLMYPYLPKLMSCFRVVPRIVGCVQDQIASYRWSIRWVAQLDGNWLPVWLKQTDLLMYPYLPKLMSCFRVVPRIVGCVQDQRMIR